MISHPNISVFSASPSIPCCLLSVKGTGLCALAPVLEEQQNKNDEMSESRCSWAGGEIGPGTLNGFFFPAGCREEKNISLH